MSSTKRTQSGTVIILSGPSASGKSSIQKKIQEYFDEPFLSLGIDNLFDEILPDYYGLGEVKPKGRFSEKDIRYVETLELEGKKAIKLFVGPLGRKVVSGMHRSIASYAHAGNYVVVDYILYEKGWFSELVEELKGVKVYYIGIQFPIEAIEERERKRATSPIGHARSHYKEAHFYDNYDLLIDNPKLTAEEIALKIKNHMKAHQNPMAFESYEKKFKKNRKSL